MSYSLIPGLESFMEDTEVNVEVAVDAPEAIEEAEETADASAEIAETTEEGETTDEQTEMIMAQYMELSKRYEHVKRYGIDRTFMRLYNSNNELSRAIRYRFPSCESFDSTGSPYSSESQAYMAGMEGILSDIWDFIVKLCKKIGAFFSRLFEAIRVRFGNLNSQIGRLRDMDSERTTWIDNIDDVDATTYKYTDLVTLKTKVSDLVKNHKYLGEVSKGIDNMSEALNKICNDLENISSELGAETIEEAKKYREAIKDVKKDARKAISDVKSDEKIKDCEPPKKYLDLASDQMRFVDSQNAAVNKAKVMLKNAQTTAENMKRRQDDNVNGSDQRAKASAMGTLLNAVNQWISINVEVATKIAGMSVRGASAILRYKKKV